MNELDLTKTAKSVPWPEKEGLVNYSLTVGEVLNSKLATLKTQLARLEQSKIELAPLLHMRVQDLRDAMNY